MSKMKPSAVLMTILVLASFTAMAIPVVMISAQATWTVPGDFDTIQEAIDSIDVSPGDTILVGPGEWDGATVSKAVEIKGKGAVIDDGPLHPVGIKFGFHLISGASGSTISHLTFQGVELPIYSTEVDDVTIEHNKIYDSIQAITNWDGDNWAIEYNIIMGLGHEDGGGIGICVGSRYDEFGVTTGNIIAHNKIMADIPDDRLYGVCGILLSVDKRGSYTPGEVSDNEIVHNRVKITGPDSDAIALEVLGLSDTPTPTEIIYATGRLHGNTVAFNVLTGSDGLIALLPEELEDVNTIFKNPGK